MSYIKTSIDQPITIAVGMLLCLLAGFIALERVPVQLAPEIEDTVIAVTTNWENASPQEVEREIVEKQEERLQGIANLRTITSTSSLGQAQIRLEFHQGADKDAAMREVSDKLRQVPEYPVDVDEPVVEASDPQSRDFIAWVTFFSDDPDLDVRTMQDFVELRVKPRLERVEGISEVQIRGGMEREVQIRFDPVQLAQRGISYGQLARAIWSTNRNASAGALADGKSDVRLRMVGRFVSIEQVENTVVRQDDGGPIYVKDLGEVVQTYKEPVDFVRANGRTVLAMNFQREIGSNVIEVMDKLQAELRDLEKDGGLLDSYSKAQGHKGRLHLIQVADNTTYIHDAIDLVMGNIWVGGALAIFVLVLFLRSVRAVGIISLAIPISVIGTIVAMVAMGRSINVISLAGIAFAVGMVVDNAIVVLENIYRLLELGRDPYRATLEGTEEVAGAVVASTLTTVVVFVPILLIQELAGQMFRDIALAICISVTLSLVVSLTVVPCAAVLLLRGRKIRASEVSFGARGGLTSFNPSREVGRLTEWLLAGTGRRLAVVGAFTVVSVAGSILLMPPLDYLPTGNRNIVFGIMIFPPGYNLDQVSEIGKRVEARIQPFWEAGPGIFGNDAHKVDPKDLPQVPAFRVPGQPPEMIQPPAVDRYFFVGRGGTSFHGGISSDPKRAVDLTHLFNWATAGEIVPGTLAFANQFPIFRVGGSNGASVEINVTGPSLEQVTDASSALYGKLVGLYGPWSVQPSPSNFNVPGPEMQVIPDLNAMSDVRVSSDELALAVSANGDGALVGEYQVGGDLIDLKLISKDAVGQKNLDGIADVPIATGTDFTFGFNVSTASGIVTLDSLSDIARTSAPQEIKRVGRQRAVTLEFRPPTGMPLQEAVELLQKHIAELRVEGGLPLGVDADLAGSASKLGAMREALLGDGTLRGMATSSLFLALLVVYLLMCVLFQRLIEPLVIMFTVPLATLGGFLALYGVHHWSLTDPYTPVQNLDVLTILGFVILAGVVVNNAILIVHQTGNFLTAGDPSGSTEPMTPRRAIAMSVESRVRPILMSSLTSVGGMLPLVVMPGSGSELYRGLGAVVCGGLLVSTIFTLFLVPALLSMVYDVREALERRKAAKPSAELAPSK